MWFLKSIDMDMENRKFQSLWDALEEVQDDVERAVILLPLDWIVFHASAYF